MSDQVWFSVDVRTRRGTLRSVWLAWAGDTPNLDVFDKILNETVALSFLRSEISSTT